MKGLKQTFLIVLVAVAMGTACTIIVSDGFGVTTLIRVLSTGGRDVIDPNRHISGNWDADSTCNPCSSTDVVQFFATTGTDGRTFVSRGRAPSLWTFFYTDRGPCEFQSAKLQVYENQYTPFICIQRPGSFFTATPASLDVSLPPATLALQTTDTGVISTVYGMPVVEFFDEYGTLLAQAAATTVSNDGMSLQVNTPDISSCYTGTYGVSVKNAMADGTWDYFGIAIVGMYGNDPPPPEPDPTPDPRCWGYEGMGNGC